MKQHTSQLKLNLAEMGRQINVEISYGQTTLVDELYSVTPHYEANILKSIMKQLDIESSVDIPKDTVINCRIGILVNNAYEYINYGNYVVYESLKQEDTNTYMITCYDKMIYSMKQNEDLSITYPITIKNYLTAIATELGLQVQSGNFYNQSLQIQSELYAGLEYTYRDILDEIAQATGSIIYINENDEIAVKYPTVTNDTIDEGYLKDVNVKFKEKYGPINSIVLSRSAETDNVYLRDEQSVEDNGLCEVKIVDNQIMNWNDRSDYLQGILDALDGLEYYINDFSSTGILYYDVGDLYNIEIGENTYQCMMLNDEIDITQGIEELIHTDMPEQSETDYEKADKTDRRINQVYLIVDKQNQEIEAKVGADEIISKINLSPEQIQINSNKISLAGKAIDLTSDNITISSTNFSVDANGNVTVKGNITATSGKIAGYTIDGNMLVGSNIGMSGLSGEGWGFWAGSDTPSSAPFRVGHNGNLYCSNANITGGNIKLVQTGTLALFEITDNQRSLQIYNDGIYMSRSYWSNTAIEFNGTLLTENGLFLWNYDGGSTVIDNKGIKIPKNGTAGYGLCNTDGTSIIRDHNNQNVTVDATGDTLFLGFQNTTGLDILNEKIKINNSGGMQFLSSSVEGTYIEPYRINIGNTSNTDTVNLQLRNSAHTATFMINSGGSMGVWSSTIDRWSWVHYPSNGNLGLNGNTVTIDMNGNITSNGSISNNYGRIYQMTKGTVNITPSGANTPTGKAVPFSKPFSSAPTVYTTPVTSAPGTTVKGTGVSGITARECVIYVTRTNTTATSVNWVAFW